MKRTYSRGILLTTIFAFSTRPRPSLARGLGLRGSATAPGVRIGGGYHVPVRYYAPAWYYRACNHRPIPIYQRVWVAPVYETVFSGYDPCGRPIYRRIVTCHGYWQNVVSGYRCGLCSAHCG
jgi:hypothetical protein